VNWRSVKFIYTTADTRKKGDKMKRKTRIAISCFISALILGIVITYVTPMMFLQDPTIKAIADVTELGDPVMMPDITNATFKVAVVVENVTTLYGLDIQFNWTTQWITYTDYTVTIPVETYSTVQPPSPYAGIVHEPYMTLKKVVDESAPISMSEPGTMAWFSYSSMSGAPPGGFNGSGTVCVFDFLLHNQPYSYEGSKIIKIHFIMTDLSTPTPSPIPHTTVDLEIPLYPRNFTYPANPMLKVTPDFVTGYGINETFTMDMLLLGADGFDLDPFWDVAGCEFYLNFNTTLIEAVSIDIDPDGDFGAFWADGTYELWKEINNTAGYVHIAFMGFGATHDPVNGTTRVANITFNVLYESSLNPMEPIDLENPLVARTWFVLDSLGGIIDLSTPVTTDWLMLFPTGKYGLGFDLTDWTDEDGDGELSVGDQIILLNNGTLKSHDYRVDRITGTLTLTQQPFPWVDDYVWAASFGPDNLGNNGLPGRYVGDDDPYNGFGVPDWTGNFSLAYPVSSVNQINATHFPFTPDNYTVTLTEGVDYIVHPDEDLVELLVPQDDTVINECWQDGVNNTLNGWPMINYVASGIESVYVDMHNGTARYANNYGYAMEPPSEWWFDPDWTWELEGWWALGYYCPDTYCWPVNSTWWVNYTAASYLTIDYNADADTRPYYLEFEGTYADFLALVSPPGGDPLDTLWHEFYPQYCKTWNLTAWTDADTSDTITPGDMITLNSSGMIRDYQVDAVSTDIEVIEKPCVQDEDPAEPYYTDPVIVDIAGFPHPERPMSPWYGCNCPVPLPNSVENSSFQAIPEFNGITMMLLFLMLATIAIGMTRKLSKKK
jgi:hypothetical protein